MSALIALLGPKLVTILSAIIAALGYGFWQRLAGAKAERNKLAAKERDSYAQELEDLANANVARNSVDSRVPDHDPYRRD